jgi:alkanesulfonate monooxygenase SsuD/methylene tetrahydromethanopterin reductase-like flavin-dependent oxidoreductase (luciferase family)
MFRSYVFTEMPYPFIPPEDTFESARVTLPNRIYDPELGHQLYDKYFDLYRRADQLGLDIMVNEHHSTMTCVEPAVPISLAILARETEHARLLSLGSPVANRRQPLRVAEEMAMIDVISQGRLECGFVRGVPMELSAGNSNPVGMKARFWEAIDLIVKAWTTHDGPFNWESESFHYRQANIWPRPYQEPHPTVWVPTQTPSSAGEIAERQYVLATILNGSQGARQIFDAYRDRSLRCGFGPPPPERLAYCGLVFVGENDSEGYAGARKLQWYLQHNKVAPQFMDVPGYVDVRARAAMMKQAALGHQPANITHAFGTAPIEELTRTGVFFAGGPDTVLDQLLDFHAKVGGFGHLLMMMQGGTMGLELAARSMELYAGEVLPRFRKEIHDSTPPESVSVNGDGPAPAADQSLEHLKLP